VDWFDAASLERLDWAAPDVPVVTAVLPLLGRAQHAVVVGDLRAV
jgi:hypothetical protein